MKKRHGALLLALALFCGLLAGCAAKSASMDMMDSGADNNFSPQEPAGGAQTEMSENSMDFDASPDMPPGESNTLELSASRADAGELERKIIRNADFSMETLHYDETVREIEALAEQAGGYVENSQTTGAGALDDYYRARWASFTIRVPADGLNDFADALAQHGSITSSNFYTEEVTEYYYDVEAHLKSLQLQEERLLEILSKADLLTDVITLESSLADVRYQIESLQGSLRRLDSLIAMSTVTISVQEVYEYTPEQGRPKGLGERISAEFGRSIAAIRNAGESALVFVLGNILVIAFWAAVIVLAVVVVRRRLRRRKKLPSPEGQAESSDEKPQK